MKTQLLSTIIAVPILLVLFISQSFASSNLEIGDIQLGLSTGLNTSTERYQAETELSAPVAKGRRTRECRILRICD